MIKICHSLLSKVIIINNIWPKKSDWSGPSMYFTTENINQKSLMCTYQWRNRTKHNLKLNVLTIITFDRSGRCQSDKIHFKSQIWFRQSLKYHVLFILNICSNYLLKSCQLHHIVTYSTFWRFLPNLSQLNIWAPSTYTLDCKAWY